MRPFTGQRRRLRLPSDYSSRRQRRPGSDYHASGKFGGIASATGREAAYPARRGPGGWVRRGFFADGAGEKVPKRRLGIWVAISFPLATPLGGSALCSSFTQGQETS